MVEALMRRDGVEDFAENDFGLGRFKAEAGRGVDRGGDGRLFLILGDGGLRRLPASISVTGFRS